MKLHYQAATATLAQLVIMLLVNFVNATASSVNSCRAHDDCMSSIFLNVTFLFVLAIWLIFLSALGYAAQNRRSRKFALTLLAAELMVAFVTFYNIRHFADILGLITSTIDLLLALFVIVVTYRLYKAIGKGAPAATGQRPRRRVKA